MRDCRLEEMSALNLLFVYLFLCRSSSASVGRLMCMIDLLWIRRKILTLFGLQTSAACLSCGRKILKIDFPSRLHPQCQLLLLLLTFSPPSLIQGCDEAVKSLLLSVGAEEVWTLSPQQPKGTSPTRIRKHFRDCFIHNAPPSTPQMESFDSMHVISGWGEVSLGTLWLD